MSQLVQSPTLYPSEVKITDFPGRLAIQLSKVRMYLAEGPLDTYLAPDAAWWWENKIAPVLCPDATHAYICMSSMVDVWRPWMSSFRAAQRKSNASLPGESPHFFGFSFDLDLETTCRRLSAVSSLAAAATSGKVHLDDNDKAVLSLIVKAAPWSWKLGDPVRALHAREMLAILGCYPHRDTSNEMWHINIARNSGNSNGWVEALRRYPILITPGNRLPQKILAGITDRDTGRPYYNDRIDDMWGPHSRDAYQAFYDDWSAAFIRPRGWTEKARVFAGLSPGQRGRTILTTFSARFDIVPSREQF